MSRTSITGISRRTLLKTGSVTAGALVFSPSILRAQGKRVRKNMMSPDAASDVASYRKAVAAMLRLPFADARNWYRVAFVHFIDCPHGNWWFTSWHRGYLGFFEETIREMSGDPDFMLPYWDWTANPYIPPAMFGADNPFDPVNFLSQNPAEGNYIETAQEFQDQVRPPMLEYWNAMTSAQMTEQIKRQNTDFDVMWSMKTDDNATDSFQGTKHARYLTASNPKLDAKASGLVAIDSIIAALAPKVFSGKFDSDADDPFFENTVTTSHQMGGHYSGLSNIHNMVHMSTGGSNDPKGGYAKPYGNMSQNLSPLDPIFFLHHANIDRLWDVWTRKQQMRGLPIAPDGDDLDHYKVEPYLFFTDAKGDPVTDRTTSWDFFDMSSFDYSYVPGSGEVVVPLKPALVAAQSNIVSAIALAPQNAISPTADFVVPDELVESASQPTDVALHLAKVSFVPPADAKGKVFELFISPQGQAPALGADSPELAGSFVFFGAPHAGMPTGFTVSIDAALDRLIEAGVLTSGAPISFSLVIAGSDEVVAADVETNGLLQSVNIHVLRSE